MRGTPSHRSPVPRDLRSAAPSGAVETHWQKDAFSWYGNESRKKGSGIEMYIRVTKTQIRISHTAASAAGIEPGDKVKVGINKAYVAIINDTDGFITQGEKGKTTKAVHFNAVAVVKQIKEHGFPVPSRIACVWDEKSGMLVAKKPNEIKGVG
ncbi:MAG: hypothetical protein QMC95_06435 [Desulfitobacteriaceae bacterium]|nr:hypothetical protein [Desulfitobacteriaceae bacterium]